MRPAPVSVGGARLPTFWRHLLIVPLLAVLLVFFIVPYANMLAISLMEPSHRAAYLPVFTISNYTSLIESRFTWGVVWHTLWLGALTTAISLVVSYPIAWQMARATSRVRAVLMILVIAPLLVGVLIRTYGWMILLQDSGIINQLLRAMGLAPLRLMYNNTGVVIGLTHVFVPFMVLPITSTIQSIDPELELAARNLGAGPWRAFRRVVLPLSLPGVMAGTVLVFVLAVSSYVIPQLLGGFTVLTVPVLVIHTISELFNWPGGSAFAILFFVVTALVIWFYLRTISRVVHAG
jgi:putative spermidine/putrescine transport system permease protein